MKVIKLEIPINPLNYHIENYIINKINLEPPESYARMTENELDELYTGVKNNFSEKELPEYFSKKIILSIRANLIRSIMIINQPKIISKKSTILHYYNNGMNILELSKKYNGSPLNLLRIIFKLKYKKKIISLIKKNDTTNDFDNEQLKLAIDNDVYALINQNEILKKSFDFELKIQNILDFKNIKYKTQEQLAEEQIELFNTPINTPDFLILNNLIINGKEIKWIDAKNFYGVNSQFMKQKIKHQTKKYLKKWGPGAIIFNLGFGSKLNFNDILLIDYDSFCKIEH